MTDLVHDEPFRVRAGEIGPGGLLRLPALCDWLQEAAGNHAVELGYGSDKLLAEGLTWVLSRLSLRVFRLPRWRERATLTTWPSGARRLWALREFRLTGEGDDPLALATSGWLIVKVATKRPSRLPAEVHELARRAPARILEDPFEELPLPPGQEQGPSFRVGRYDLDLNAHANNVSILRWLLEALPAAAEAPFTLEAEFRGECFEGDVLLSRRDGSCAALFRQADGREVARAVYSPKPVSARM